MTKGRPELFRATLFSTPRPRPNDDCSGTITPRAPLVRHLKEIADSDVPFRLSRELSLLLRRIPIDIDGASRPHSTHRHCIRLVSDARSPFRGPWPIGKISLRGYSPSPSPCPEARARAAFDGRMHSLALGASAGSLETSSPAWLGVASSNWLRLTSSASAPVNDRTQQNP